MDLCPNWIVPNLISKDWIQTACWPNELDLAPILWSKALIGMELGLGLRDCRTLQDIYGTMKQ